MYGNMDHYLVKSTQNYLSPQDFDRILEAIPILKLKKWSHEDVAFVFKMAYWLDLRITEAVTRKVEDFDFERHELYLGRTKTEKGAVTNIPPPIEDELKAFVQGKKGRLFPGLTRYRVYDWITKLGRHLDITCLTASVKETGENTKCHIFRKSMAKDMLYGTHGKKAPLNVIMKSLRHTNLGTTTKYLRVQHEDVKDWWRDSIQENDGITL